MLYFSFYYVSWCLYSFNLLRVHCLKTISFIFQEPLLVLLLFYKIHPRVDSEHSEFQLLVIIKKIMPRYSVPVYAFLLHLPNKIKIAPFRLINLPGQEVCCCIRTPIPCVNSRSADMPQKNIHSRLRTVKLLPFCFIFSEVVVTGQVIDMLIGCDAK